MAIEVAEPEASTGRTITTKGTDAEAVEGARPTVLLPISQLIRISAYWLGLTAIDTAVQQFIQFRLNYSDIRGDVMVGMATAIISVGGAAVAIFIQPTVGAISDYTVTRWGRRKPYIVFGSLLDLAFLMGIAFSNTLFALMAFVILLQFSTNTARGPFQGYVPDLVAEKQVGMASGMVGMMQILGNISGAALASGAAILNNMPLALAAVAVVELVTMASVVLRVGKGLPPKPRGGKSWARIARETWATDILAERSYVWLLASRLIFLTASGVLVAFSIAYMKNVFGYDKETAGAVNSVILAVVVVASLLIVVPASRLSDVLGRKAIIYMACATGAVGVAIIALAPTMPVAILGAAVYGASSGTFLAVDWALMTDIIPRVSAGRYMGLSNVATGSATLLSAVVGGLVLDAGSVLLGADVGPRLSFAVAAALYGVAAMLLRPVVEPRRTRTAEPAGAA